MFTILAAAGIPVSMTVSERNDPNRYNHIGMQNRIYKFGAKNDVKFVFQTKDAQKNHSFLLDAFAGFHQNFPKYELHIFGQGSLEKELRNRAVHLGIGK